MESMNKIVARNVKTLREKSNLSMDQLVRLSGVSKSMLAQIEKGEANPTISTLWKISNGLKVPFDALTVRPKSDYEIVKTKEVEPLLEDKGRVRNYSLFRMMRTEDSRFIIWNWIRKASGNRNLIYKGPQNSSQFLPEVWKSGPGIGSLT